MLLAFMSFSSEMWRTLRLSGGHQDPDSDALTACTPSLPPPRSAASPCTQVSDGDAEASGPQEPPSVRLTREQGAAPAMAS